VALKGTRRKGRVGSKVGLTYYGKGRVQEGHFKNSKPGSSSEPIHDDSKLWYNTLRKMGRSFGAKSVN
jgi:hypothetical protein